MADNEGSLPVRAMRLAQRIATGQHVLSRAVPLLLLLLDAMLCVVIIKKVPYTEIDWTAYMEQVQLYQDGEREYTKIEGGTGPLVYPAAHVWIYNILYDLTGNGKDILLAQKLFAGLYLVNLAIVMTCYRKAKAPPYILPMLILSKRLHSIFMLRCFNDCFATFFFWLSVLLFQHGSWLTGSLVYSWGIGVKMVLLLALPVVGILIFFTQGIFGTVSILGSMGALQVLIAIPFLQYPWAYLSRAFEFSRQFFFKWTVNWRFVGEETFLSKQFSQTLLALHASILLTFILTRWLPATGKTIPDILRATFNGKGKGQNWGPLFKGFSPKFILTTVLTANVIGLLFARSLHYQFYAYLAWSTPYLLWRSGLHPVLQYTLWAAQEWAWNVFPSTPISSAVVVAIMAITVALVWYGTADDVLSRDSATTGSTKKR
ncbi:dolichyl-P-Man:Man(5)GlcNAc(2)-PP-dolichol alpha-1,3-mannosyltransferase [Gnomoniopsis smithogilvyi]|uniref:Dol-P-Man:Man(5)GlcNAc(2)-PP-Dol alpha-1,3-mannosyltransferase n=1 Tax=Gnomoniopsis smithogilvyi TaxID=1191159 RepID=A0A9W8YKN4_9PEZI|nr:dolichyl-P-Man:Man(5)GlcNAc(2)-PP-dolichol alpha-1,3-mannosyltransferase [Gnomoniopsis smithogilvyi]